MVDDKKVRPIGELDRMAQFEDRLTGKPPILRRKTFVNRDRMQVMIEEYVTGKVSVFIGDDFGQVFEVTPESLREIVKFVDEVLTSAPPRRKRPR
jgi:hypothetical protein